jgi:hypothetical protein
VYYYMYFVLKKEGQFQWKSSSLCCIKIRVCLLFLGWINLMNRERDSLCGDDNRLTFSTTVLSLYLFVSSLFNLRFGLSIKKKKSEHEE